MHDSDKDLVGVPAVAERSLYTLTPADIERQVMATNKRSGIDDLRAALDAASWLLARARTIDKLMTQIAASWVKRNGALELDDRRFQRPKASDGAE